MFVILLLVTAKKFIFKCKYKRRKKLRYLIPGYEGNPTRFSHDPNKVIFTFSSHDLTEHQKNLHCKGFRFSIPPKRIDYGGFLIQFELLYRSTFMFEMKSENRGFIKNKLKDVFFYFEIV